LCSAVQLSNDSEQAYFAGNGSQTVNNDQRTRRQETQLQLDLGESGTISVGPRHYGDVTHSYADWHLDALDVDPDSADAECVLELQACNFCWISLAVIINRLEESLVAKPEDDQYLMTVNNDSNHRNNTVSCRLWLVNFVTLRCI